MTTLISFLGKNRADPATGYRTATYRFDDGQEVQTAFFGSALASRLQPHRILLLGTSGSMWDALNIDTAAPQLERLIEATEEASVDQVLLDQVMPYLVGQLSNAKLVLVPFCRSEAEQMDLLATIARHVTASERVVLDVTHGFRHLPMLALVAARYLVHVRQAEVTDIYYGALEMAANGVAPVLKLDGLLRMLDWIEAFAAHDASGNYAAFAPLLEHDGMPLATADRLAAAAHFERVTNSTKAREQLLPALPVIDTVGGATRLFAQQLTARLAWVRKPDRHDREMALHEAYLLRNDHLRAGIYLQESFITEQCFRQKCDPNGHASRDEARRALQERSDAFKRLTDIRNKLAHGSTSGAANDQREKISARAAANASDLSHHLIELRREIQRELNA